MTRGRLMDIIFLCVAILIILFTQMMAAPLLDTTRQVVFDVGVDMDGVDSREHINSMYTAVVRWIPLTVAGGLICLAVYREYRRQKFSGLQRRGRI